MCREVWAGYICDCEEGFGGLRCSEEIGKPWRFQGDGLLSFNPLLRPVQLPWLTSLSLRTRDRNSFLMSIQIGQNSTVLFEIKEGKLETSLDGILVVQSQTTIADGEWHRIEVTWQSGHVFLDVDYRNRPIISPLPAKLQGLFVGRILVGGSDQSFNPEQQFFDGCIQVFI